MLLLAAGWSRDGKLPADDTRLANMCGRCTLAEWLEVKPAVIGFFDLDVEHNFYTQKRQLLELEKAKRIVAERSKAGKAGADRRWQTHSKGNGKPMAEPMANRCTVTNTNKQQQESLKKTERPTGPTKWTPIAELRAKRLAREKEGRTDG
jgi:uncharacterized protein YdaU (DUF1376 family)